MDPGFVHLHAHSEYSLLQSTARVAGLVRKAKELKQPALALTDHGNLFGALEFYDAARKAGIKPLIGCDLYVAPDSRRNQNYAPNQSVHHKLILLAYSQAGYKNLLRICSDGYLDGYHQKPRVDHDSLRERSQGLICLSSNYQGELGQQLLKGNDKRALEILEAYAGFFGKDNVYLSLQSHGLPEEETINRRFLELHRADGWKLAADNDAHYLEQADAEAHDVLLCIEGGWKLRDANRPRFPSDQYHLRSSEEMAALFGEYPGALENTLRIAEQCDFEIETGRLHHPEFPIPEPFPDADAYLAHLSREGLSRRAPEADDAVKERLEFELGVMRNMHVAGYMLVVQDFVNAAKARGIPVGPGRGSAVGSLVCYATGITDVDPIRFNLLFERFLNPERVSMPDIDTDFSDNGRQEVIQYVVNKYGQDSVAQIVTYGRLKAKAALKDVARALGIDHKDVERINKFIPPLAKGLQRPKGEKKKDDVYASDISEVNKALEAGGEPYRRMWDYARSLEGLARQAGMHAAAVIIAPKAVVHYAPLFKQPGSDQVMIQYDMRYSESIGLLKMDFLGLRNLSVIQDCVEQIRLNGGPALDPLRFPEGDPKTYALLGRGQTVGVFQFESAGMQDYLRKLRPTAIEDMVAMNALYRPGPMEFIGQYIARKRGVEKPDYYHPDLEPILRETYGVIVYQEQVMQIAQVVGGFSLGGADLMRRAMGKKDEKKMKELKPKFVDGAKERGYAPELAEKLWDVLVPFSSYAFNKSHSVAYALVAYQTAYLKANYPAEFMAANMNSEMQDSSRLVTLLNDCKQMGLEASFPDVNVSRARFTARGGSILYGLGGIKNVGFAAVERLVEEREKNGPFRSVFDLCKRLDSQTLNRRALESLILAGALPDEIPGNRAQQFAAVESFMARAQAYQQDRSSGQESLFGGGGSGAAHEAEEPPLPDVNPWPYHEMLEKEKEVLGLYLSNHPLKPYRGELASFATCPLDPERLKTLSSGSKLVLGGMITRLKTRISPKDNKTFAFADLEDFAGKVDVAFWSDVFEDMRPLVEVDSMVLIRGTFQRNEDGSCKLVASKAIPLSEARERIAKSVHARVKTAGLLESDAAKLRELCLAYQGRCQFVLHVECHDGTEQVLASGEFQVSPEKGFTDALGHLLGDENVWLSAKLF